MRKIRVNKSNWDFVSAGTMQSAPAAAAAAPCRRRMPVPQPAIRGMQKYVSTAGDQADNLRP